MSGSSENRQSGAVVSPALPLVQELRGLLPDLPGACPDTLGELLILLSALFTLFFLPGGTLEQHVRVLGAVAQAATTISVKGCEGGRSTAGSARLQGVLVQMCYSCKLCFPCLSFLQEKD